jgi:hypothetical protein
MEWTEIDYNGTPMWAMDFCSGVLIRLSPNIKDSVYIPGWRVQHRVFEMDGPILRPMDKREQAFKIVAVEV